MYNVHCLGSSWTRGVSRKQKSLLFNCITSFPLELDPTRSTSPPSCNHCSSDRRMSLMAHGGSFASLRFTACGLEQTSAWQASAWQAKRLRACNGQRAACVRTSAIRTTMLVTGAHLRGACFGRPRLDGSGAMCCGDVCSRVDSLLVGRPSRSRMADDGPTIRPRRSRSSWCWEHRRMGPQIRAQPGPG